MNGNQLVIFFRVNFCGKKTINQAMLRYSELDTLAMAKIQKGIREIF